MCYGNLAQVYDELVYDMPYERWMSFLAPYLSEAKSVLEIGCGTGNLTRLLARSYHVTAVDLSGEMLQVAAKKLRREGLSVAFVEDDVRTFSLHKPADACVCACDTFNYLLEDGAAEEALRQICAQLKPGAPLIFDISTPSKLKGMDDQLYSEDADEVTYLWRNSLSEDGRFLTMELSFFVTDDGENYRRFDEEHVQRLYEREELASALVKAGFVLTGIFDDYTEAEATDRSARWTFTARKREE